jgi:hypothetical protein
MKNTVIVKQKQKYVHIDIANLSHVEVATLPARLSWAGKKHKQSIVLLSFKLNLILVLIWVAAETALLGSKLEGAVVLRQC